MPHFGQAGSRDQADVSGSEDRDAHVLVPEDTFRRVRSDEHVPQKTTPDESGAVLFRCAATPRG
jgi:hypothetical protein